jgi:plastocyanin
MRKTEPLNTWLVPYTPTAQYGGIFLYSNVIWGALWVGLFFALRRKQDVGNLRTWLLFFLISLAVGTGFAEASLNWSQLPVVMQLGSKESQVLDSSGISSQMDELQVKILEGSSIQGNPGYEPSRVKATKDNLITWINADVAPHTVTSGVSADDAKSGMLFDSGSLGQGQKFSMPASQLGATGNYDYYCIVHPFMKGMITIQ